MDSKVNRGLSQLEAGEGIDGATFFESLRMRETGRQSPE